MKIRSRTTALSVALLLSTAVAGCSLVCGDDDGGGETCVEPPVSDQSVVIHDPALLVDKFAFGKTIDQIIAKSDRPATDRTAFVQSMLDTFAATSFPHPALGVPIPVNARPGEAGLSAAALLDPTSDDAMIPVGLFNRFDLAPADGSNCGEHRIVYAKKQSGTPGRFFLIFEARLPNPAPASGLAGCKPITDLWTAVSADPDDTARVTRLEGFFYGGIPADGVVPVVQAANYGMPDGQIRSNLFINFIEWQLREHLLAFDAANPASQLVFAAETVKDTPLAEWFSAATNLPPGLSATEQTTFRNHFLNEPVCNLVRPDRVNPAATTAEIVNGIAAQFDPVGNEFQSVSDGDSDNPGTNAEPALRTQIAARLTALPVASLNEQQVLNRAGAMTCGGCHRFSDEADIGNGHQWPKSAFFVHIRENGDLSDALNLFFVPRRREILADFACDQSPTAPASPDCPAADGAVDAPQAEPPATDPAPAGPIAAAPEAVERVRSGRTVDRLKRVDDARLRFLSAIGAAAPPGAGAEPGSPEEIRAAIAALDSAVQRARTEERNLSGAFAPVRRTH